MIQKYKKLNKLMMRESIDVCIINSPENIFYLTGLTPNQLTVSRNPNFAALIYKRDASKPVLTTMDYENICFELKHKSVDLKPYITWVGLKTKEELIDQIPYRHENISSMDVIEKVVNQEDTRELTIGLEEAFITSQYRENILSKFSGANFKDISPLLIEARSVKTDDEVTEFKKITEVCDKALLELSKHIKEGISEEELISYYKKYIFNDGRYLPSGWTMLGFGINSSTLSRPTDRVLTKYDSIRFDGGANADFEFYTTDFSRSWLMPGVDPILKELKSVLYKAQRLMISKIKPGLSFKELFNIGFEYVKKYYPNYTRGHLGHSISLGPQTAESPIIEKNNDRLIEKNMILCIEVPLYISDLGGFNIEDMVLVTEDSCEILTSRTPHFLDNEEGIIND